MYTFATEGLQAVARRVGGTDDREVEGGGLENLSRLQEATAPPNHANDDEASSYLILTWFGTRGQQVADKTRAAAYFIAVVRAYSTKIRS